MCDYVNDQRLKNFVYSRACEDFPAIVEHGKKRCAAMDAQKKVDTATAEAVQLDAAAAEARAPVVAAKAAAMVAFNNVLDAVLAPPGCAPEAATKETYRAALETVIELNAHAVQLGVAAEKARAAVLSASASAAEAAAAASAAEAAAAVVEAAPIRKRKRPKHRPDDDPEHARAAMKAPAWPAGMTKFGYRQLLEQAPDWKVHGQSSQGGYLFEYLPDRTYMRGLKAIAELQQDNCLIRRQALE
jgi:hypothetical protein